MTAFTDYEAKFHEWDFSTANGRRVAARPVSSTRLTSGTLFISTDGTGVGTIDDPASLAAGTAQAVAGDVVFLRGGIYELAEGENWLPTGGTVSNPTTWESYPGEIAIFETDPAYVPAEPGTATTHIFLDYAYTIFRRFELRNMAAQGVYIRGSNIEVHGVWAHHNNASGIHGAYSQTYPYDGLHSSYNLIQDCIATDNSDVGFPADGGNADGISITNGIGNVIRYCEAGRNSDDGIDVWETTESTVEYCVAYGSGLGAGNGQGFKMGNNSAASHDNIARFCLAYDNLRYGIPHNLSENLTVSNCSTMNNGSGGYNCLASEILENNVGTDILYTSPGTHIDNSWNRAAGMAYVSTTPYTAGFMVPVSGYKDIGGMVTNATYTLQVNADGSQNTGYPAGDKPGAVLVPPDSFTAVAASTTAIDLNWNYNSSGHTGFEIQQWIQGTSTSWQTITTVGPTTRYYQATGLPAGTHIGHRIRASDEV